MIYERPLVVSYGGGVNSTALLIGLAERGVRPDLILFADTGGERPDTYGYVRLFSAWLEGRGQEPVTEVRYDSRHGTLEQECVNNETLPSLAYGFKGCSVKWKRQPMDKFVVSWQPAIDAWAAGGRVTRAMGIDAGEAHRGQIPDDKRFVYVRPLVDWGWAREECLEAIERAGLPSPGKSACFFCPAMKKGEVLALAREAPDLFERAVRIEQSARNLQTVRGLGRHWTWEELVRADRSQGRLFPETVQEDCMCADGSDQ